MFTRTPLDNAYPQHAFEFSKSSYRVEKLHTDQSGENFGAYNGLLVNFDALNNLQ